MDGNLIALENFDKQSFAAPANYWSTGRIIEFYEEASVDYGHWSRGFNMHVGFCRRASDFFDRERMFEQLNLEIAARLRLDAKSAAVLIDLGCGLGAVSRSVARLYPNAAVKGVTLSPAQVEAAAKLNMRANLHKQIEILEADYTALPFADGAADGAWAIESACYAEGASKENLVREMARVLKTGGRFVVADCFVKNPQKKFNKIIGKGYAEMCKNWALTEMPTLEYFVAALKRQGFCEISVEDISRRAAPSVAHMHFAVFTFILKKLFIGEKLKRQSINNLKASLIAPIVSLNRSKLGYYLISGKRG